MDNETKEPSEDDVRTEYSALCANLNHLASFRFALVGFYIATLGLITSGNLSGEKFALMLWVSLCFWILELRNRGLLNNMAERGCQIEHEFWGYKGERAYEPFISHWSRRKPLNDPKAGAVPPRDAVQILFFKLRLPVSHTLGLDLLFLGVMVYSIIRLLG
jgi:hypothetical protein